MPNAFPPFVHTNKKKKETVSENEAPSFKSDARDSHHRNGNHLFTHYFDPQPSLLSLNTHTHTTHTLSLIYLNLSLRYLSLSCASLFTKLYCTNPPPHRSSSRLFSMNSKNSHFPFDNSNCFLLASYITIGCFRFSNYYYFIDSTLALFSGDLKKRRRRKSTLALKKSSQQLVQSFHSEFTELVRPTVYVRKVNIQTITHSALLRVFHLLFTTVGSMTRINSN